MIILRLWFLTAICFGIGAFAWNIFDQYAEAWLRLFLGPVAALIGSLPALVVLYMCIVLVQNFFKTVQHKFMALIAIELLITLAYGVVAGLTNTSFNYDDEAWQNFIRIAGLCTAALFASALAAVALSHKKLTEYFSENILSQTQINTSRS